MLPPTTLTSERPTSSVNYEQIAVLASSLADPNPIGNTDHKGFMIALIVFIVIISVFISGLVISWWIRSAGERRNRRNANDRNLYGQG
jgi:hypothetical protein